MKNKEIEEILKFLKEPFTKEKTHKAIDKKDTKLLLSYIEQLRKKIDQYENPDDLTLFYMWLDEKAKDKMKQLETDYKEANESVTWWQNRYNAVERDKKQLENNRDKAIEYNKNILKENWYGGYEKENAQKNINILKGGSDE